MRLASSGHQDSNLTYFFLDCGLTEEMGVNTNLIALLIED